MSEKFPVKLIHVLIAALICASFFVGTRFGFRFGMDYFAA